MTLKAQLHAQCALFIHNRIVMLEKALAEATAAGNDETKSTAGDKHETGRAMAQLEQEKNAYQLQDARQLNATFSKITTEDNSDTVLLGSVVRTTKGNFYIAVAAGKLVVGEEFFTAISLASPLGKAILGKRVGDTVTINNQDLQLLEVL